MAILPPPEPEPTPSDPAAALPSPFAGCRVSMFENAFGKVPRDADLASILEAVRKGRWREQVEALRALLPANLDAYDDGQSGPDGVHPAAMILRRRL